MRIVESGGVFTGKVEKMLDPDRRRTRSARSAPTSARTSRSLGMTIIRDVKPSAGDKNVCEGGDDPRPEQRQGLQVRKLTPVDGGKKLDVRGYIGAPMLGRTQTWHRVE